MSKMGVLLIHACDLYSNKYSIHKQDISNIYLSACCYDLSNGAHKELRFRKLVLLQCYILFKKRMEFEILINFNLTYFFNHVSALLFEPNTLEWLSRYAYTQYLNCKILHGETLLQPWPNFSGNYVIPSPQLKCFFPQNQVKTKKKRSLHGNLGLYSAGICRIYSWRLALDRFIIKHSNLIGWTSKSRWGDANSQWGDASLCISPTI